MTYSPPQFTDRNGNIKYVIPTEHAMARAQQYDIPDSALDKICYIAATRKIGLGRFTAYIKIYNTNIVGKVQFGRLQTVYRDRSNYYDDGTPIDIHDKNRKIGRVWSNSSIDYSGIR